MGKMGHWTTLLYDIFNGKEYDGPVYAGDTRNQRLIRDTLLAVIYRDKAAMRRVKTWLTGPFMDKEFLSSTYMNIYLTCLALLYKKVPELRHYIYNWLTWFMWFSRKCEVTKKKHIVAPGSRCSWSHSYTWDDVYYLLSTGRYHGLAPTNVRKQAYYTGAIMWRKLVEGDSLAVPVLPGRIGCRVPYQFVHIMHEHGWCAYLPDGTAPPYTSYNDGRVVVVCKRGKIVYVGGAEGQTGYNHNGGHVLEVGNKLKWKHGRDSGVLKKPPGKELLRSFIGEGSYDPDAMDPTTPTVPDGFDPPERLSWWERLVDKLMEWF
jgi:hypothetical protein